MNKLQNLIPFLTDRVSRVDGSLFISLIFFVLGGVVRYYSLNFVSIDMSNPEGLLYWYDVLQTQGFAALGSSFSIYTPPYLYLLWLATKTYVFLSPVTSIKLISIAFDIANVVVIYHLLQTLNFKKSMSLIGAAMFWVLPTVLINSAYWGQAESVFSCFVFLSLLYLLKDRSVLAMVFFGIAFSIKAQPLFLGPFLFLLFLRKRLSFSRFLIVPVVYMSMMLPAIYMGRPALELLLAYGGQASKFQDLTANAPTLYAFIPNSYYDVVGPIGFVFTAIWALLWSFFYARRLRSFPSEMFILAAFVSLSSIPFLLPKMHDRYFYLADVASLLVAMYYPSLWFLTAGYQIVSGMAYYVFLVVPSFDPFGDTILKVAALLNLAVVLAGVWAQWQIAVRENLFQEMRFLNQTFVGIKKYFISFGGGFKKIRFQFFSF